MSQTALSRNVTLKNELGMHLRAAGKFVDLAGKYQSEINVIKGDVRVDGKSIIGLLSMALSCGTEVTLEALGQDAEEALVALSKLVEIDRFFEAK